MTFGSRVKARRKELGYSQQQLATMVGMSRSAVNSWELGDHVPGGEAAMRLPKALKCSWEELTTGRKRPSMIQEEMEPYASIATSRARLIDKSLIGRVIEIGIDSIEHEDNENPKLNAILDRIGEDASFAFLECSEGMSPLIEIGDLVAINTKDKACKPGQDVWLFAIGGSYVLGRVKETVRGLMLNFENKQLGWEPMPITAEDCCGKVVALMPKWLL